MRVNGLWWVDVGGGYKIAKMRVMCRIQVGLRWVGRLELGLSIELGLTETR